jgi:hypothetical protein
MGRSKGGNLVYLYIYIYIYINKDETPSIKSPRHVETNVIIQKENQKNQNSNNEIEDLRLKGHCPSQMN